MQKHKIFAAVAIPTLFVSACTNNVIKKYDPFSFKSLNSCLIEGMNYSDTYLPIGVTYFTGNQPTEKITDNTWLIVERQLGVAKVSYFDTQSNEWIDKDLVSLYGVPSSLLLVSPEGYSTEIKLDSSNNLEVIIIGGFCIPKTLNS